MIHTQRSQPTAISIPDRSALSLAWNYIVGNQRTHYAAHAPIKRYSTFLLLLMVIYGCFGKSETANFILSKVMDITIPVVETLLYPIEGVRNWTNQKLNLLHENQILKLQNTELLKWQQVAVAKTQENQKLRVLLNTLPEHDPDFVTTRVIGLQKNGLQHQLIIKSSETISKNDTVITRAGILGRITSCGKNVARVLLLTDVRSRIPVYVDGKPVRAILSGTGSNTLKMSYVEGDIELSVGDKLMSSGEGGVFPRDYPVAVVSQVSSEGIKATILAETPQDYVAVIVNNFEHD